MHNNNCYDCKERYLGCHDVCPVYAEFREKIDRTRENRHKDLAYRGYKRERTINIAKVDRAYENRGFSTL